MVSCKNDLEPNLQTRGCLLLHGRFRGVFLRLGGSSLPSRAEGCRSLFHYSSTPQSPITGMGAITKHSNKNANKQLLTACLKLPNFKMSTVSFHLGKYSPKRKPVSLRGMGLMQLVKQTSKPVLTFPGRQQATILIQRTFWTILPIAPVLWLSSYSKIK